MENNYTRSRQQAQQYFLGFSQERIAEAWNLPKDAENLYVTLFGKDYSVCRTTGTVMRRWDKTQADYCETLSIFDLLCYPGTCKYVSGRFAPVNSLKNAPINSGVGTDFHKAFAQAVEENPDGFAAACQSFGAVPVKMGDMAFRFPVFDRVECILKFYHADSEFPPSVTILWEENLLQFVHYETVFYLAGSLVSLLQAQMIERKKTGGVL